jgi:HAD superfamily hydrolase (TIGR01450 family)|tara:strand:+ start:298 stop:1194 length:897 start_codon:yes stop_codon:yes gene_type:complete
MKSGLLNTKSAFDRYEAVRHRLPVAKSFPQSKQIRSLLDITDQIDAFVFDAFGVLNVGEAAIPGAVERLKQLRELGCAIRVLSNAASFAPGCVASKFKRLGFDLQDGEIITSRESALHDLDTCHWGVIAARGDALSDVTQKTTVLKDDPAAYDAVDKFLFLSTADWTNERQQLLEQALIYKSRNIRIANADLVAPRDDGFSLEPGYFGHRIADVTLADVEFFGKPFPHVYKMIKASLPNVELHRIAMCGDSLHTDILGATSAGWRSVLVTKDGLFAGSDVGPYVDQSGLWADWSLERI